MNKPPLIPWKIAAGLICAAWLTSASSASAAVLLTDNFNITGTSNSDDNLNLNFDLADRQGGALAPATYDGWALHHQVGNNSTDVGQPGGFAAYGGGYVLTALNGSWFSDLDVATISSGPLTIDFDMFQQNDGSTEWGAFALRFPGSSFPVAQTGEFGFLQQRNGALQVFQNGNNAITPAGWNTAGFAPTNHWTFIFSDTAGTGSAFVGNGSKVTIMNGTLWTNTITLTQLNSKNLRMGWCASGGGFFGIDNLVVQGTLAPPIPNLSFEQDAVESGNIPAFTGWHRFIGTDAATAAAVGGSGGDIGSQYPTVAQYSVNSPMPAPADGSQFLFINMLDPTVTGGIYQDMGPMIPNHTYNLVVAIGSRADRLNSPGIISLVNGTNNLGTVLISSTNLPATQDTWQDYSVQYTTGPSVSGDLTICLSVLGDPTLIQADFDNVRLDPDPNAPPVPVLVQNTLPTHVETFVGDQVVFTAVYSNTPPVDVQWLVITNGVTNTIPGATSATLTLNNVQTTDSGSYRLMAVNATNSAAAPSYSKAAPLVVSAVGSAGNVVVKNSGQTGPSTFYPAWTIDTNLDLIFGAPTDGSGSPGTAAAGPGSYGNQTGLVGDPTILADGNLGSTLENMVSCGWVNVGAGQSMTYTLPTATYGYDITNITIYGGWPDDGRNEQKYQILYSTTSNPGTFVSIGTFDYNPSFTSGEPNASRVILVPAAGALAQNVYAVEINFNMQSKNNWNGYSEITVNGSPSSGIIPALTQDITPLTAEDVVGSSLILTAGFTDATSFQWQKNGTNILGATSTTLTLNNLQPTDTATNGGYRLLGINAAGTNFSRGCSVIVDAAPAATNNVVTAYAYQTSDATAPNTFGPTWDTSDLASSLIFYAYPTTYDTVGNFADPDNNFPNSAGGLTALTDNTYGVFAFDGSHPAFATAGPSAGQYVVYTLGYDPNGYDVTNIQIAGGWNDNGRNSQFYTVSYSTVQNPTLFTTLNAVSISPTFPSESVIRTTMTPATGVLASNVYAIEVNFLYPQGVPNGYSGYSQISVFGSVSANPPPTGGPVITAQNELGAFDWTVETPNLIANQLPSSYGPGVFTEEGCAEAGLTDGILSFGGNTNSASCGDDGTAVPWVIFSPANGGGWDLTNIVVYSMWHDYGRDGQFYNLSYSTLSDPTTFVPLASVSYNPDVPTDGTASGNRVAISPASGQTMLASNVAAVKFDFTPQGNQDFGWSGYSEIVLQGSNLAPVNPPAAPILAAPHVSNGNLILTGTGGTPNSAYTWLTTTNLTPPIVWETNTTGLLDSNGAFSNSIPISTSTPEKFFRLRQP